MTRSPAYVTLPGHGYRREEVAEDVIRKAIPTLGLASSYWVGGVSKEWRIEGDTLVPISIFTVHATR